MVIPPNPYPNPHTVNPPTGGPGGARVARRAARDEDALPHRRRPRPGGRSSGVVSMLCIRFFLFRCFFWFILVNDYCLKCFFLFVCFF